MSQHLCMDVFNFFHRSLSVHSTISTQQTSQLPEDRSNARLFFASCAWHQHACAAVLRMKSSDCSFWPQVIINYRRKSVEGVSFDFAGGMHRSSGMLACAGQ